ncbi:hypothetical protein [Francisella sp. SYW-2]|uniref:hypothetical protein n=1 Tax=Francisella sp. SYW-2 TaxID=2610886 RepID=UPI00123C9F90|nr:hypothetical protein [Francisella sp. SYW-2]
MAKSNVKQSALRDLELLSNVVDFKNKFYPNNWAKYDDVKKGLLKLLPNEQRVSELKKDYQNMQNMIFAKNLTFEDILETLHELEKDANLAIKG